MILSEVIDIFVRGCWLTFIFWSCEDCQLFDILEEKKKTLHMKLGSKDLPLWLPVSFSSKHNGTSFHAQYFLQYREIYLVSFCDVKRYILLYLQMNLCSSLWQTLRQDIYSFFDVIMSSLVHRFYFLFRILIFYLNLVL